MSASKNAEGVFQTETVPDFTVSNQSLSLGPIFWAMTRFRVAVNLAVLVIPVPGSLIWGPNSYLKYFVAKVNGLEVDIFEPGTGTHPALTNLIYSTVKIAAMAQVLRRLWPPLK